MSSNPRPAKRLRRSSTIPSEEDVANEGTLPLRSLRASDVPTKDVNGEGRTDMRNLKSKRTRTISGRPASRPTSSKTSPQTSPEKSRKSKALGLTNNKNKSLRTFFSKATDEERWRKRSATPDIENRHDLTDDIIDDDSLDETPSQLSRRAGSETSQRTSLIAGKPFSLGTQTTQPPSSSQRFRAPTLLRSADIPTSRSVTIETEDVRPWAELYSPCNLEELSIHKKKIQDVQGWLLSASSGKIKQKILVLKGPAGSGKSTTIELLCRSHNYEIVRWQNPDISESGALASSLQFAEFVSRGGDYGALSMDVSEETSSTPAHSSRVLLVEDFPASLSWNSIAMESFRSALLQAIVSDDSVSMFGKKYDPSARPLIVLVVSETLVSSSTSFTDSFTAHRLLGPELINHAGVSVIEFNPVATTFLSKALDLVIKKEARDSGRRRIPGSALLQKLAEMGDVRNAINSLQILCTRGDDTGDWSGTVAARTSTKRSSKSTNPLSKTEERSIKLISSRETTLDMFHAAGKVCYNKRDDPRSKDAKIPPLPKPPDHMMHLYRAGVPQVDVDELLGETGTDVQTFVATVHQNYVLSCNHDDFVDHIDGCASVLSDSALLDPNSRVSGCLRGRAGAGRSFQFGTIDTLRQDEISFNVATRGVLFSLPYPVSRAALPDSRKMDAFKMFYPASLRMWKPMEEINDLVDMTIAQLSGKSSYQRKANSEMSGVSSWRTRQGGFSIDRPSLSNETSLNEEIPPRLDLHKDSLILDTLPYLTTINSRRGEDVSTLRKITQIRSFNIPTDADADAEDDPTSTSLSATARLTQRVEAVHDTVQRTHLAVASSSKESKTVDDARPIEKLWIEDDDIEDVDD